MTCILCGKKSVIDLQQGPLCRNCFIRNFQKKVYKTVRKFRLFTKRDRLCFAVSGGPGSLSVLYIVKNIAKQQRQQFFAVNIDEGGKGCKNRAEHVERFCRKHGIESVFLSFEEEFGKFCEELSREIKKKKLDIECSELCTMLRMNILAKYAKRVGAARVALGNSLDDEARAFMMNLLGEGTPITSGLGPSLDFSGVKFIKPLYMCTAEEISLYAKYMHFGTGCDCACSRNSKGAFMSRKLESIENDYPGTKTSIIQNMIRLMPALKKEFSKGDINNCKICGEPSKNSVCKSCSTLKKLGIKY
ncbi:MAG: hypothetical protein JSV63_01205 [Candidatus Aenigmatarchaeota archaeon]|nr:MAG: hypothetical protein JSV63_01205 [Candidatus Aenigmarchaeota archaeon]